MNTDYRQFKTEIAAFALSAYGPPISTHFVNAAMAFFRSRSARLRAATRILACGFQHPQRPELVRPAEVVVPNRVGRRSRGCLVERLERVVVGPTAHEGDANRIVGFGVVGPAARGLPEDGKRVVRAFEPPERVGQIEIHGLEIGFHAPNAFPRGHRRVEVIERELGETERVVHPDAGARRGGFGQTVPRGLDLAGRIQVPALPGQPRGSVRG